MTKYIDCETAKAFLTLLYGDTAQDCIDSIPAVDVAPVVHGRWLADKEDVEWGNYLIRYRCSECKERPHFDKDRYTFIRSPYCPNCGAKMDKEAEDD